MKLRFGLIAIVLLLLAVGLFIYGDMERTFDFVEEYENTSYEKRPAVAEAFRNSCGIDKWSIGAVICLGGSIASGVAAFRLSKNKSSQTT